MRNNCFDCLFYSYVHFTATERALTFEEEEIDENCVEKATAGPSKF